MSLDDFLSTLDPKTAAQAQRASEYEIIRRPLISKGLTHALGGGIAAGRVCTIFGNPSAGKSLLSQGSIGKWQKEGLQCAYGDAEGTFDKEFAERLGVDTKELLLSTKKSTGAMTDQIIPWIEAGLDVLVIDSISDLLPEVFVDGGQIVAFEKQKQMMAHAKSITMMLNAIHYANTKTAVILLSQTTTKVEQTYVEQIPHGGQKIQFGSSQMVRLTSSPSDAQQIKGELQIGGRLIEKPIGRKVKALVKKNKLGRSHDEVKYNMYYAGPFVGIDTYNELVTLGEETGVVHKGGAWYEWNGQKFQGELNFAKALRKDNDLMEALDKEVTIALNGGVVE